MVLVAYRYVEANLKAVGRVQETSNRCVEQLVSPAALVHLTQEWVQGQAFVTASGSQGRQFCGG